MPCHISVLTFDGTKAGSASVTTIGFGVKVGTIWVGVTAGDSSVTRGTPAKDDCEAVPVAVGASVTDSYPEDSESVSVGVGRIGMRVELSVADGRTVGSEDGMKVDVKLIPESISDGISVTFPVCSGRTSELWIGSYVIVGMAVGSEVVLISVDL